MFADSSSSLWDSKAHLDTYDIAIFSCEGGQHPLGTDGTTVIKSQADMDAVKAYTDGGGRRVAHSNRADNAGGSWWTCLPGGCGKLCGRSARTECRFR